MLLVEKNSNSGLWVDKCLFYKVYIKKPVYNADYVLLFYIHVLFQCFSYGKQIKFHFLTHIAKFKPVHRLVRVKLLPLSLQISRPASLKMLRQYARRGLGGWVCLIYLFFFFLTEKYFQTYRRGNTKSDLSFKNQMLYHIACLRVLLNSSQTVLRITQFSNSFFNFRKPFYV